MKMLDRLIKIQSNYDKSGWVSFPFSFLCYQKKPVEDRQKSYITLVIHKCYTLQSAQDKYCIM